MTRTPLRWALPLLIALADAATAAAQAPTYTLRPGDEVRVDAPTVRSSRVRGTVVLYQGATLDVRELRSGAIVSIPIQSIRELSRNEGLQRGRSSWRMARFGAFVGGAAGFVSGPLIATTRAPKNFAEVMLVSGVVGTLGGAGAGAVLGALFAQEHWQRFRMPVVPTLTVAPGEARLGVAGRLPSR